MGKDDVIGGGMGGSGGHASEMGRELRVGPEDAVGDVPVERRHHHDENYRGPDRRQDRARGSQ
jgi:hypothetical protein